jgi:hypothetical protein
MSYEHYHLIIRYFKCIKEIRKKYFLNGLRGTDSAVRSQAEPWKEASCMVQRILLISFFFMPTAIFYSTYQSMSNGTQHFMLITFLHNQHSCEWNGYMMGSNIGKCNGEGGISVEIHNQRKFQVTI